VNGKSTESEILDKLSKYGITDQQVTIWGTGKPLREFLWSEDMADACVFLMENVDFKDLHGTEKEVRNCHINIGTGKELTIKELADLIAKETGYTGTLYFDETKPDGTMRKLTDPTKLHHLGWHHRVEIQEGIHTLYHWYLSVKNF
jgi:GDP-L-fucose synthase